MQMKRLTFVDMIRTASTAVSRRPWLRHGQTMERRLQRRQRLECGSCLLRHDPFVDLDGDQRADVCGRSPNGIVCSKSTGDAFGSASLWSDFFGDANGWRGHSAYWIRRVLISTMTRSRCVRARSGRHLLRVVRWRAVRRSHALDISVQG